MNAYVKSMTEHYAVAALWSSLDWNGMDDPDGNPDPLDDNYAVDDIDAETYAAMSADCQAFYDANRDDIGDMSPEQCGHDFWLTRNGHGAGFWDRGLGERGKRLSAAARVYGEVDLFTLNGKVYAQ